MNGFFRLFKYSLFFFLTAFFLLPQDAISQRGRGGMGGLPFGRGPKTTTIQYDYFDISEINQISLKLSSGREMGLMRFSTMNLAGGIRFDTSDSTTFRWRVGLLDADLTKKFFSFGGTILNYDQIGMLERDFTYLNLRFGPALRLGNPDFAVAARVTGAIGASEIILGELNYPGAGFDEATKLSGFEVGYNGKLAILFNGRFTLIADYVERIIGADPEPHFKTFGAEARMRLGRNRSGGMNLFFRFEREEFSFSDNSFEQKSNHIIAGLQILPGSRGGGRGIPFE